MKNGHAQYIDKQHLELLSKVKNLHEGYIVLRSQKSASFIVWNIW